MLRQTPIGLDLTRYSLQPLLGSIEDGWELVSPLANFKVCSDTVICRSIFLINNQGRAWVLTRLVLV